MLISNVNLRDFKAIESVKLNNLGKVNIFCGKNNSGKTTLLKALLNKTSRSFGISEEKFKYSELYSRLMVFIGHTNQIVTSSAEYRLRSFNFDAAIFENKFKPYIKSLKPFYQDELSVLCKALFQCLFDNHLIATSRYINAQIPIESDVELISTFVSVFENFLSSVYSELFNDDFNNRLIENRICYIEPKRLINESSKANFEETLSGRDLLKTIQVLKNANGGTWENNLYQDLQRFFNDVSVDYRFNVPFKNNQEVWEVNFSPLDVDKWRSADDCGLGLQDLLVIIYHALEPKNSVVLIEEPENHLHPELQRRLLKFLKEDTPDDKQFFLTTHSNIFLDDTYSDRIFHTSIEEDKLQINDATSTSKILSDLGYSAIDNLTSDLTIVVEGIYDKKALIEFLKKMDLYGSYNIKFLPLGGDLMEHVDLEDFAANFNLIALLDKDPKSSRNNFVKQCRELKIPVTTLKRYSMESYFPVRVYRECFEQSGKFPKNLKEFDPEKPVWAQLGNLKKTSIKQGSEKFAQKTELEEIKGTDLWTFLGKVKKMLKS